MKNTVRLDKLLAKAGFGSRKEIKELLKQGSVTVNGQPARDGSLHVTTDSDRVAVDAREVCYREFIYLMLNKPAGYVSATTDSRDKTVIDLVPPGYRLSELFPVGRLDKDTEGLLILTNDGQLAHQLLAPKKHVPKTYYARVEGLVTGEHVRQFAAGITLEDGYQTMPARLQIVSAGDNSEVVLIIHEGKFHQVKRMFKACGTEVLYLKRTAMGGLTLDQALKPGEIRELTPEEINQLACRDR